MFIKELLINVDYLKEQVKELKEANDKLLKDIMHFGNQLLNSIGYYRGLTEKIVQNNKQTFIQQLECCEKEIKKILQVFSMGFAQV